MLTLLHDLELSDAMTQSESHVSQLRSMMRNWNWYSWWHHVRIANSLHLNSSSYILRQNTLHQHRVHMLTTVNN